MASYVPAYGKVLICPFNKSHLIREDRMQTHLFKCEKQHPRAKILKCVFNATHVIPVDQYHQHLTSCEDRGLVDSYRFSNASDSASTRQTLNGVSTASGQPAENYEVDPDLMRAAVADDENWDEMNEAAYNPAVHCAQNRIIRKATHMTASQKKKFYESEQLRFKELKKQEG